MAPSPDFNLRVRELRKGNLPTSPLFLCLRTEISSGGLSDEQSRTERSLICRRALSPPISSQVKLRDQTALMTLVVNYLGDPNRVHDDKSKGSRISIAVDNKTLVKSLQRTSMS
jgi:hypothetical protein